MFFQLSTNQTIQKQKQQSLFSDGKKQQKMKENDGFSLFGFFFSCCHFGPSSSTPSSALFVFFFLFFVVVFFFFFYLFCYNLLMFWHQNFCWLAIFLLNFPSNFLPSFSPSSMSPIFKQFSSSTNLEETLIYYFR